LAEVEYQMADEKVFMVSIEDFFKYFGSLTIPMYSEGSLLQSCEL